MKTEIMAIFHEFHLSDNFDRGLETSFITLVTKIRDASSIKDFKPTRLFNKTYEFLSKAFATRLKGCLDSTISPSQGALIKDRQILDGILVANEVLDS